MVVRCFLHKLISLSEDVVAVGFHGTLGESRLLCIEADDSFLNTAGERTESRWGRRKGHREKLVKQQTSQLDLHS